MKKPIVYATVFAFLMLVASATAVSARGGHGSHGGHSGFSGGHGSSGHYFSAPNYNNYNYRGGGGYYTAPVYSCGPAYVVTYFHSCARLMRNNCGTYVQTLC